ncbi:hypothetical protein QBC46DRAFT_134366 [Diplogelasinospora grovesii]|uniref:DUF1996 domain-containing protein n=1 Tax=Diplogelasinospora grovesii TaxID=303347 RepID=A0AAN6S994_9PEZI|nr:hypothetical protein QBC46DRAFT_134366 [Diplogelasinospora grovesii]
MKTDKIVAVLAAVSGAAAFWRMECRGRVGLARIDPLISPGEVSQHAHTIHGSSGFSETATYDDLVNANCTSCAVTEDKSAYWTPAMYFRFANGTYQLVEQVGGMLAYYFLYQDDGNPTGQIQAFPKGFRMIAGDSLRRNYSIPGASYLQPDPEKSFWASLNQISQNDLSQRAIGFNCLNYARTPEGSLFRHYLPDKSYLDANCADGVRLELMFPSCWNGKDLDAPNHKDHVAYPDLVSTGACPQGFNVKLPGLFYETIWATDAYRGIDGEFVISNGDVQGFGYHGDFIMGWDQAFLQNAVNTCTNMSGEIQDCPLFTILDQDTQRSCSMQAMPSALVNEQVAGTIGTTLPGNVAIQYGPGEATAAHPGPQTTTVAVPTVSYSPGASATGSEYQPGQVFHQLSSSSGLSSSTSSPVATPATASAPAVTPAPAAPSATDAISYEAVRTDYVTAGNVVSEIVVEEAVEYVTVTTATVTVTVGGPKAKRETHMHRHKGRHGHTRRR